LNPQALPAPLSARSGRATGDAFGLNRYTRQIPILWAATNPASFSTRKCYETAGHPCHITREKLIDALNEDLSREYQAIIAYVNYSQVLKGAAYMNIADELAVHAKEELDHALQIANHMWIIWAGCLR
jgi:hypothetical protein